MNFMPNDLAIIIPARLSASRLPNKPLADIAGTPMIIHVARRATAAAIGPVFIATGDKAIVDLAYDYGFTAILTQQKHETGSDRVFEALCIIEQERQQKYKYVMNLQGDLPNFNSDSLKTVLEALTLSGADIATLANFVNDITEKNNENVVKLIAAAKAEYLQALYFTRAAAPHGTAEFYKHIGIYLYKRDALEKFIKLPTSKLEQQERLEQLRALEAGMTIAAQLVIDDPISVDTLADLEQARILLAK